MIIRTYIDDTDGPVETGIAWYFDDVHHFSKLLKRAAEHSSKAGYPGPDGKPSK